MAKKKMAKKKVAKKTAAKKKTAKKAKNYKSFGDWWSDVAQKKVDKIEKEWLKENEPNDPDDDGGGDHWHVNQMMHDGMATEMTSEIAEEVWNIGASGKKWEQTMDQSLFCELDAVIEEAYEAGKKSSG